MLQGSYRSGVALFLIRYLKYQTIDSSFKTSIQATMTKVNTADGSPMTALGMTALLIRIADFKLTHNFIICGRLPDTEILFRIAIQKIIFPSICLGYAKELVTYRRMADFSPTLETVNRRQLFGIVKSSLKIPPRHNDMIPIKIKGHTIKGYMAYFISNQDSTKGKDPVLNITNGINIKGKRYVSNYTNKHISFNKGEHIGYLEPPIEEISQSSANPDAPMMHSITTERMMEEKVKPDTFKPPCHKLKQNIETRLMELLKEYNSQFAQDETYIRTTPLTDVTIDTGTSEPVSLKPYPIAMKHYK